MKLLDLLCGTQAQEWQGPQEIEITGISTDSRQVKPGHLFIAVKGTKTDGHQYIATAVEKGAAKSSRGFPKYWGTKVFLHLA